MSRTPTVLPLALAALLAAAGCSSSPSSNQPPPGSPPPAAAGGGSPTSTGAASSPSSTPASPAAATVTRCTSAHLALQVGEGAGGGHQLTRVILRNAGTPCTLSGFPGVSFADQLGTPVATPAQRVGPTGRKLTLATGQVASSEVDTVQGTCTKSNNHPSEEIRVFAPGDTGRLQTYLGLNHCGTPSTVTALVAGDGGGPSGPPVPVSNPVGAGTCSSTHLALAVAVPQGAAGSAYIDLILRNAGTAPCRLSGYPGVTLYDMGGHQIGKAAEHNGPSGVTVTLAPGQVAHATLQTTPAACASGHGDNPAVSVRVFPPGEHGPLTNTIIASPCGTPRVTAVAAGASGG